MAGIELVEVRSFRLEVPRLVVERLPQELAHELELELEREPDELVVAHAGGESFLRFRARGPDRAQLTEVSIARDAGGRFFHAVLGPLLLRYAGDLKARLIFDPREATAEPWCEVRVVGGLTAYPGLATHGAAHRLAAAVAEAGPPGPTAAHAEDADEVERLLERARAAWRVYLALKARRGG